MQRFSCPTQIISGAGAVKALKELGIRRLLLVTDPYFYENGTAQAVAAGVEAVEYFYKVKPDPTAELAAEGTAAVQRFGPDAIAALGGGSAMDCAKAMAYFSGSAARLIAIPTTSGSGSEVTDFAILTHGGVKHPLVDPRLRPEIAILDSDLVAKLPPALIADGGFDVLTHAAEAFVATNRSPITDALARDAFATAFGALPRSYAGRQEARCAVHSAATMAGMAFTQAGLGLCHALAHSLGGQFHIPHGRLNAILLPAVIRCNATAAGGRYAELARAVGLEGRAETLGVRNLISALVRLRKELGLPATLEVSLAGKREAVIEAALADPCCATNPAPVSRAMAAQVLDEVCHG